MCECREVRSVGRDRLDHSVLLEERKRNVLDVEGSAQEAQSKSPGRECERASAFYSFWSVTFEEVAQAKERSQCLSAALSLDRSREIPAERPSGGHMGHQTMHLRRRLLREIALDGLSTAALGGHMLANELFRAGIDDAQPESADVYDDAGSDVARRRRIEGAVDLDVPVDVNAPLCDAVILKPRRR